MSEPGRARESAALPSDVRKGFALPARALTNWLEMPIGRAKPFRTSDGI